VDERDAMLFGEADVLLLADLVLFDRMDVRVVEVDRVVDAGSRHGFHDLAGTGRAARVHQYLAAAGGKAKLGADEFGHGWPAGKKGGKLLILPRVGRRRVGAPAPPLSPAPSFALVLLLGSASQSCFVEPLPRTASQSSRTAARSVTSCSGPTRAFSTPCMRISCCTRRKVR